MDSLSHTESDNGQQKHNSSFGEYSQAFWRLLEVARALASMPLVTLLDEPMAGLNPSETVKMLKVINRAREERNVAILWVEHKVDAIFHLCDQVVVLDYGCKIAEGPPELIARNPDVIEAYLGQSPA